MSGAKKKILLIEDEKLLIEMYAMRLEKAGYQVTTAPDGEMGLATIKKEKPDLIILDIVMPKKNGYEVLKALKDDPQTKDITVLVFSNLGQEEEIKKGLAMGADDYIIKTEFTPKQLLEKIEKMFAL